MTNKFEQEANNRYEEIGREISSIAASLALENNSFYRENDIPYFLKKLVNALEKGGWPEVNKVKLQIKYAGTDEKKAAFMAGRED